MSFDGLTGGDPDGGSVDATGSSSGSSSGASSSSGSGSSSGASEPDGAGARDDGGAGPQDGGSDAVEDSHSSPPLPDASVHDSGRVADATSPDSAPGPYCTSLSPAPLFCDDFDEGALAAPWDQLADTSGAETLNTAEYVSAPYSMLVSVDPDAAVTAIDVAGYKSFTAKQGVAGTATATFDIRINAADESSASDAIVGAIQLWNGSAYWDLELEVFYASSTHDFSVSMSEDDGTSYVQHAATAHLAMDAWTRVTLAVVLPAGAGGATTATMAFSGTTVASATVHVSTNDPIPEILIGTTYATPAAGGWSVAYDNVTFDEP
jgi:hypothetical protein